MSKKCALLVLVISLGGMLSYVPVHAEYGGGVEIGQEIGWNFNDGSGAVASDTLSNNPGTIIGGVFDSLEKPYADQGNGYSIDLRGSTSDRVISDSPLSNDVSGDGAKTLCGWVKPTSTATTQVPFYFGDDTTSNGAFGFRLSGGVWSTWSNGINDVILPSVVPSTDWHHICASYDGVDLLSYYDGNLINTTPRALEVATSSSLYVGGRDTGGEALEGWVDDVRVYTRALSTVEVRAMYDNSSTINANNNALKVWLKSNAGLNEINGEQVDQWLDQSNTGQHANSTGDSTKDPLYEEGGRKYNFHPYVNFDNINDRLTLGSISSIKNSDYSIFAVGQRKAGTTNGYFIGGNSAITNQSIHLGFRNDTELTLAQYVTDLPLVIKSFLSSAYDEPLSVVSGFLDRSVGHEVELLTDGVSLSASNNNTDPLIPGTTENVGSFFGYPSNLNISEILVFNTTLSEIARRQVESYIGLKYGTTLDQTVNQDYLSSNPEIKMWSNDDDSYEYGIFGIGRDDNSGLDQRVSASQTRKSIMTLSLDTDFVSQNSDALRSTAHTNDLQFLTIAHNGDDTNADLSEVAFPYIQKTSREWKVDKTSTFTQNVAIEFANFGDKWELLEDDDGDFSDGAVSIGYLDNAGVISNVNLQDGKYYTLASQVRDIAPGGVINHLDLWFKSNAGISKAFGEAVDLWADQSSQQQDAVTSGDPTRDPLFLEPTSSYNFYPYLSFDNINDRLLLGELKELKGADYSIYGVVKRKSNNDASYFIGSNTLNPDQGLHIGFYTSTVAYLSQYIHSLQVPIIDFFVGEPLSYIRGYLDQTVGHSLRIDKNGLGNSGSDTDTDPLVPGSLEFLGTYIYEPTFIDHTSDLDMVEIAVYSRALSTTEKKQLDAYFALKYGLTIDQTVPQDYLSSDELVPMWTNDGDGYDEGIVGLGRDDKAGLHQVVSTTQTTTGVLTLSLDDDFVTGNDDLLRSVSHQNDIQFLAVAHNGASLSTQKIEMELPYLNRVLREWKIDKTDSFDQTLSIKFDGFDEQWFVVADDDGDFTTGTSTIGQLNASGEINDITLEDGMFFTLAQYAPEVSIISVTPQILEGGASGEIRVQLDAPNNTGSPLVFTYTVSGSSNPATDVTPFSGTVSIPDGESAVSIPLQAIDNLDVEGFQDIILTLDPTPGYRITPSTGAARVVIVDDEDTDGDLRSNSDEDAGFNSGDGNGDGILDSLQATVSSKAHPITGTYSTVEVLGPCTQVINHEDIDMQTVMVKDITAEYPLGLTGFTVTCPTVGSSTQVTIYYSETYDFSEWVVKKYLPTRGIYRDISSVAVIEDRDVGGVMVTTITYTITDGDSDTDDDGLSNGTIIDPTGPAIPLPPVVPSPGGAATGGASGGSSEGNEISPLMGQGGGDIISLLTIGDLEETQGNNHGSAETSGLELTCAATCPSDTLRFIKGQLLQYVDGVETVFMDIVENRWYICAINYVLEHNIASGYKTVTGALTGIYQPDGNVTFAEALKMVTNLRKVEYEDSNIYKTNNLSARDTWATEYVIKAEESGLSLLVEARDVHRPITRGEVMQMVVEIMGISPTKYIGQYDDVMNDTTYADAIATLTEIECVQGDIRDDQDGKKTFRPDAYMNRAEMAELMMKLDLVL